MLVKLNEAGTEAISKTGDRNADFSDYVKEFSPNNCAFGIYDHPKNQKLIFVHWNPDSAPVRSKMASASAARGESY